MKKFRIVFASGAEPMENLSAEQMLDFKDNNWDDFAAKKFRIEEIVKIEKVERSESAEYEQARQDFYDGLGAVEINDIKVGKKKISHNAEKGFYLRTVKSESEEYNISLSQIEAKRKFELRQQMRSVLMRSMAAFLEYDILEVEVEINELFKNKLK